ncbi:hypothetical protein [Pseudoalteromonas luteoviolacea]|uniref:Uncharacterized protein n=1 Tax=Pseudoalteromonas luteoviolacea S4054 TaxID=1129367 RepID=A0A0F6ABM1_9GAMM|nr:hypothetical protein [Pseudoalteromonas luteoviolacea]AOT10763.1 hypothetical protein S4054249_23200 [Pseudoalteromonas luteoviolacea]AOT16074.1 hypothetical protein S40542_25305 [Pseudoalteromonas luteoviolacea]AOT20584.1 hypothetical protein S4054_23120 [Pseudoalteromonas luteoviolacea]KKE82799.1 hypothetical protein N479_16125 [Pseudoalteromonas luteoviolacea S4054]KZN75319.1 hypothetical protein N481_08355 [Pseudoalteromonas luteoviolacea S4047-1]
MLCYENTISQLNFIEPQSLCDYDLINEVASSDDLTSILTTLLFDDTLSADLKKQVKRQLRVLKASKRN